MHRHILIVLLCVTAISFADDIYSRIDKCEANGGGTCVFNLFRELAKNATNNNGTVRYCRCDFTGEAGGVGCRTGYREAYYEAFLIERLPNGSETRTSLNIGASGCSYEDIQGACMRRARESRQECK